MRLKAQAATLTRAFTGAAFLLAGTAAQAATFAEIEPNNALASAQFLASTDSAVVINGARSFADTSDDFFSFEVRGAGTLSISSTASDSSADSIMGLYDASGALVASDDDSGPGAMSAITFNVLAGATGRYTLGFSGYNPGLLACSGSVTACYDTNDDFVFDTFVAGGGAGGSAGWNYAITLGGVALVPEPATLALFAFGAPLLLWARRRRR